MGILFAHQLKNATTSVSEAVFARQCAECGRRGGWVCGQCRAELPRLDPVACTRCAADLQDRCLCADLPAQLAGIAAAFPWAGWARSAVVKFKFESERARAGHLARELALLMDPSAPPDLLVPVPLHSDRLRSRGYNQAGLLARELGKQTGIPVGEELVRRVERGHQVGLSRSQRWEAVRDAFACSDPAMVRGKRIVIVDDVITTGATVSNCALALDAAGTASVWAVAVARG